MACAGCRFMIRYGLDEMPSVECMQAWARAVGAYLEKEWMGTELAGELAAQALFEGCRTRVHPPHPDTVKTLLELVEGMAE